MDDGHYPIKLIDASFTMSSASYRLLRLAFSKMDNPMYYLLGHHPPIFITVKEWQEVYEENKPSENIFTEMLESWRPTPYRSLQ